MVPSIPFKMTIANENVTELYIRVVIEHVIECQGGGGKKLTESTSATKKRKRIKKRTYGRYVVRQREASTLDPREAVSNDD